MIKHAMLGNKILTWILRFLGFGLMTLGIVLILHPLTVIADVLPILGDILQAGTMLIALLVAGVFSFLTMAIGWLFYRPVHGVLLIVVATALVLLVRSRLKAAHATTTGSKVDEPAHSAGGHRRRSSHYQRNKRPR